MFYHSNREVTNTRREEREEGEEKGGADGRGGGRERAEGRLF